MSDELTTAAPDNGKTELSQWDKSLVDFKARYSAISTTDKEQYEPRRLAVKEMRETRGRIEERRLELTRPLIKAQKDIKAKADWLVAEIEKVEEPLRLANKLIDEEAARLKKIAEQDERDKAQQATKAALDALAERQRKEADAERAKLKEQADALAAEKATGPAAAKTPRAEAARVMAENNRQREALAAEQKKFRDQQEAAAKVERDRLAAIEAVRVAKENAAKAEVKRVADEAARLERERLEAERREAMLPDVDKIRKWADMIDATIETAPAVNSDDGFLVLNEAFTVLANLATKLREFGQ